MVPKAGVEPARTKSPQVFETSASTNSATSARKTLHIKSVTEVLKNVHCDKPTI